MSGHGVVIGKFYPPHVGHHYLVRAAASRVDRLTVVVMGSSVETISLADRVAWMRAEHGDDPQVTITGIADEHPIDYQSDSIWRAHVDLVRQAVASVTASAIDVVATSEPYGDELARRLGARHEAIDPDRTAFPISGTKVRADPIGCWDRLAPATRAGLSLRVILVGAESTGKTTLAE